MLTLADLFKTFKDRGSKNAMIYRTAGQRLIFSYQQLYELSVKMAGWLERQNVKPGDRVVLWAPNSPWWAIVFWGCVARGAIVVPADFRSDRARTEKIVKLSGARLIIQSKEKLDKVTENEKAQKVHLIEDFEHILEGLKPLSEIFQPKPEDTAELIYTSGTTGEPKGVKLTHKNLTTNLKQVTAHIKLSAAYNFLSLLPLSHMFEQMGGFLAPLKLGSSIVYIETLKPEVIMAALGAEDIYAMMAVPRLLQLFKTSIERKLATKHLGGLFKWLLRRAEKWPRHKRKKHFYPVRKKFGQHFQLFVSGGAALDAEVFKFWDSMGFTVLEGYGLTECAPVLAANTLEQQMIGSVGTALPGVQIKIDTNGEILAKGDNIFPGYYHNDKATKEVLTQAGWFKTGDIGHLDEQGNLYIKGRIKETIVTAGGLNVYPDDLEPILNKIPGVKEACVIGFDQGQGEEVHAVLVLDDSKQNSVEEIIQQANSKLDRQQRITSWSLWPEPELPKTTTLKFKKFAIKDRLLAS